MFSKLILAGAFLAFSAAPALAKPAGQFLEHSIKGDNSESNLGRLIDQRAASAQVRSFGRTLHEDHSNARKQAAAVARHMSVPLPRTMAPEAKAEYRKLSHMQGRAFDMEVRRYMINDHRKDIADFKEQARTGDSRTAALAREQLPTLRKHLRMAESIRG